MDLSGISRQSMDAILNKMELKTSVRFRKTNISSDKYVEQMRFRQKARLRDGPLILKITFIVRKEETWSSMRRQLNYSRKIDLEFSVATCNCSSVDGNFDCIEIDDKGFEKIDDPYKQLSAVHFDHIYFNYPKCEYGITWEEIKDSSRKHRFAFCRLFLYLERLRLSCRWFSVYSLIRIPQIEKILKLVEFEKISFECPWCPAHIEALPIQHCTEVHLTALCNVPLSISPVFLACSLATIASYTGSDSEEMMDRLIKNFLKDVEKSQDARGHLKQFDFEAQEIRDLSDFPGAVVIWNGVEGGKPASMSKLKIDEGFTYLYYTKGYCHLRFVDEEDDSRIIQAIKDDFGIADGNKGQQTHS